MNRLHWPVHAGLAQEFDGAPRGGRHKGETTAMNGTGQKITHIDHPVRHLTHAEPGSLTQLLFLVLARVWVIRMAMEPILEIVCHWFWQFASFPFWSLCHGGSGGGKGGDGI